VQSPAEVLVCGDEADECLRDLAEDQSRGFDVLRIGEGPRGLGDRLVVVATS
jgi:hypothetical protein